MYFYVAIACLLGVAMAAPSGLGGIGISAIDHDAVPRYGFNYAVNDPHTGDNKAQSESRDGGLVKGSYSLTEPDGTLRVVDYQADPISGFNAVVKRVGPAAHPQVIPLKHVAAPVAVGATSLVGLGGLGHGIGLGGIGLGHGGIGLGYGGIGLGYGGIGLGHGGIGLGQGGIGLGYGGIGLGRADLGLGHGGIGLGGLGLGDLGLGLGGWKH